MNAERLHVISLALFNDFKETDVQTHLNQLVKALKNQIEQPNQPNIQEQVSNHLLALYDNLSNSETNNFSPAWLQVVEEIGAYRFVGNALKEEVQSIFERNSITPSVAHTELNEILTELNKLIQALDKLTDAFYALNIGSEELEPGDCELGILVPRLAVENSLPDFGEELVELNKIFNVFSEIATGSRENFTIRTISSSDLTVFLDILPEVAACTAVAIERIIALYKQLLEIRKLKKEIQEQGVPAERLQGVEEHANTHMDKGLTKLVEELLEKFYTVEDKGRKNELRTETKYTLNKLAKRIDRGYNIDIRIGIEDREEEDDKAELDSENQIINTIRGAAEGMKFIKLEGDPILSLPESSDENQK